MKNFLGCKELVIRDEKRYNELSIMTKIDSDISQLDTELQDRIKGVITTMIISLGINHQSYSFELFVRIILCADYLFSEETTSEIDLVVAVGENNKSSNWFVDDIDLKPYLRKIDMTLIKVAISDWISGKLTPTIVK